MTTIDVVIPSYRLNEKYLIPIIHMEVPEGAKVRYLIISDNPGLEPPARLMSYVDGENILFIRNKENLGASQSRNVGIDRSTAEWILFLDDDVQPEKDLLKAYFEELQKNPGETGFFGLTIFPDPHNSFTKGLVVGGMLYFFYFARHYDRGRCATTSNVLVSRAAIGDIRFNTAFPKKGGGEDFAFFLEIFQKTGQSLKTVKEAAVYHNWWHDGKRNYTQFMRWSYGDFELFRLFPKVTYLDFPNMVETLAIGLPVSILAAIYMQSIIPVLCILIGVPIGEVAVEFIHKLREVGLSKSRYVPEVVLVRSSADLGRFYGQLVNSRLKDLFRRPNYSIHEIKLHFRLWTGLKFLSYILISVVLWYLFQMFT